MKALATSIAISAMFALSSAASAQQELWERATVAYETQHFAQALTLYEQLAHAGSAPAAEIAGTMLLCGEALYGVEVRQDRTRAALMLARAAKDGRSNAQVLLDRIQVVLSSSAEGAGGLVDHWSEPQPFEASHRAD